MHVRVPQLTELPIEMVILPLDTKHSPLSLLVFLTESRIILTNLMTIVFFSGKHLISVKAKLVHYTTRVGSSPPPISIVHYMLLFSGLVKFPRFLREMRLKNAYSWAITSKYAQLTMRA